MQKTLLFRIAAKGGKAAARVMQGLGGSIGGMRRQLAEANKVARHVAQYRRLKGELADLSGQFRQGGEAAEAARRRWRAQAQELRRVSATLRQAGEDTKRLAAHQRKLAAQAARVKAALKHSRDKMQEARAPRQGALGDWAGVAAPALAVAAPLKMAMDFESAMADVKKVVNFKEPEGFQALGRQLLMMSTQLPIAASGLAEMAAAAGQLGVAEQHIAGFVTTTAKMAVAFDMLPAEAGDAAAKLSNVFNVPITRIGRLGDAINHLSDNTAAKAREITRAMLRIGGTSVQFGLAAHESAALAAAFIALGKPPEVAGTAINGMLTKLMTAEKGGKRFQQALAALGVDAYELKDAIQKDAQGALLGFLQTIAKVDKTQRMGVLVDLFGREYADDVATLVGNLDKYRAALGLVAKEQNYLGSMTREFQSRSATTEMQLQLLKNKMGRLAITAGSSLLPALNAAVAGLGWMLDGLASLQEAYPNLCKWIHIGVGGLAASIAGFKAARMAARFLGGGLREMFQAGRSGALMLANAYQRARSSQLLLTLAQRAAALATKVWTAAQWLLNVALNANPIGLIVAGVAALAAGAYLLIRNWEAVKGFFAGLWRSISNWFGNLNLFESGKKMLATFVAGIKSMFTAPVTLVKNLLSKVREYLPFSDAKRGPLSGLTRSGKAMMTTFGAGVAKAGSAPLTRPLTKAMRQGMAGAAGLQERTSGLARQVATSALTSVVVNVHQENRMTGGDTTGVEALLQEGRRRLKQMIEETVAEMFARQQRMSLGNVGG